MIGFKRHSKTKWETSYYGGFYNLIFDHPDINIDIGINHYVKNNMNLPYYSSTKLIKIFLLKIKQYNLIGNFLKDSFIEERKRMNYTYEYVVVSEKSVIDCIDIINDTTKDELQNLFIHYQALLISTEFSYEISVKKNENENLYYNKSFYEKVDKLQEPESKQDKLQESESKQEKSKEIESKQDKSQEIESKQDKSQETIKKESIKSFENKLNDIAVKIRISYDVDSYLTKFNRKVKFINQSLRNKTNFSYNNEICAGQLLKMLDISFDPQYDKVSNLRTGKFDQRKVAEVVAGNFNTYYTIKENQVTKPFSVCILCDESGSMDVNMSKVKDLVKTLYLTFNELLPPEKLFIYGHSGSYTPEAYVYQDKYNNTFEETIDNMQARDRTYDGPIIEAIYNKIREFTRDNIIFIIITDGQPSGDGYGGEQAVIGIKKIIEKCRRDGFVTIGIGIQYFVNKNIYNYSTVIMDIDKDMVKKTSLLINHVVKTEFQ